MLLTTELLVLFSTMVATGHLYSLSLYCNNFAGRVILTLVCSCLRLEDIPDELAGLTNLTDLHLSQNLVETLPAGIGQLAALTICKLDQNRLMSLHPNIGRCVISDIIALWICRCICKRP